MTRLALAIGILALVACSKDTDGQSAPPASSAKNPDRYANGKALAAERAGWKKAWGKIAPLPSCDGLQIPEAEKSSCKAAAASRDALANLEKANAPTEKVLDASLKLAEDGTVAWSALREHGLRWLIDDLEKSKAGAADDDHDDQDHHGRALPSPPAKPADGKRPPVAPTPPPAASSGGAVARVHKHAHGDEKDPNPWTEYVRAYLGAAQTGMNRLSGYLRLGPVDTRRAALNRLKAFIEKHPRSRVAHGALSDAWFSETDRSLKQEIGRLREEVGARRKSRGER